MSFLSSKADGRTRCPSDLVMRIRIVIDINLSPQWVNAFIQNGMKTVHWSSLEKQNASDIEISEWTRKNE
jgi:predicted nuclease of predicted toxin-antitoxin system